MNKTDTCMDWNNPYPSARSAVLGQNMVSTSHPLAAQAGLRMLQAGGNAVDAALAAAIALTVLEPTGCGIGSDAFAIVWDGKELHGLNASGRSPRGWSPDRFKGHDAVPDKGWESVSVPGAVSAWAELSSKLGRLSLEQVAAPAIHYAREGFPVSPVIARLWELGRQRLGDQPGFAEAFLRDGKAPVAGQWYQNPDQANTLERIAATQGQDFYTGELAKRIADFSRQHGGAMDEQDLAEHRANWCGTISHPFAQSVIHEIPPNGQGLAALMALGIMEQAGIGQQPLDHIDTVHLSIEAMKLAFADLYEHHADLEHMIHHPEHLLDPAYLRERAALIQMDKAGDPKHGLPGPSGTVYVTAADSSGMMVSLIQSNYMGFGSGVVVPGTGISMQNRGHGFTLRPGHVNEVAGGKRPSHTIIPAFAMNADGTPQMSFGVMGGPFQSQGHMQMALRVLLYGQNPQAAADAPRWRVTGGRGVAVEPTFDPALVQALRERGHEVVVEPGSGVFAFGGAQLILRQGNHYVGGSDPRKDGQVVAY